jgi:hypothetical protein
MAVKEKHILKRTIARKEQLLSVATKISMQLNCKLGGELWEKLNETKIERTPPPPPRNISCYTLTINCYLHYQKSFLQPFPERQ